MKCKIHNSELISPPIDKEVNSLVNFASQKLGFNKPPVIFFDSDEYNASKLLGKTGYYDPDTEEVHVYVTGRHPKDILRSFAHEIIHHIQNLEGRLGGINTTNTNEDDYLDQIEREAYEHGNMTFRNWTDSILHESTGDSNPLKLKQIC